MFYLEKINTHTVFGNRRLFYQPGYIDMFLNPHIADSDHYQAFTVKNISRYFKEIFLSQCNQHDIICGSNHGYAGVDIYELLLHGPDENTLYEIGHVEFLSLPWTLFKRLCKINLLVHDFSECGFPNLPRTDPKMVLFTESPNIVLATDNLYMSDFNINKHLIQALADQLDVGIQPLQQSHQNRSLVMARKPRNHRMDMLQTIERRGLLPYTDWSLNTVYDESVVENSNKLHHVTDIDSNWADEEFGANHEFARNHRHELPKEVFVPEKGFESPNILHPSLSCKYKLYVSLETFTGVPFVTEKTYKAALAGLPFVIYGTQEMAHYVKKLGFQCFETPTLFTCQDQREDICDFMESDNFDYSAVEHNFQLATDQDFVIGLATTTLSNIFKEIFPAY